MNAPSQRHPNKSLPGERVNITYIWAFIALLLAKLLRLPIVLRMVTARQIRAARALLNWTQQEMADAAIVSLNAVRRLEKQEGDPRVSTVQAVEAALQKAGVEFLPSEGVRLAERTAKGRRT